MKRAWLLRCAFELLELSGHGWEPCCDNPGKAKISGFSRYAVPTLFGALKLL